MQTHEIQSGDILVISTDGLFDNLYEDEIGLIINEHINNKLIENKNTNHNNNENHLEENLNKLNLNDVNDNDEKTVIKEQARYVSNNKSGDNTLNIKFEINNDMLESACELLIQKASKCNF